MPLLRKTREQEGADRIPDGSKCGAVAHHYVVALDLMVKPLRQASPIVNLHEERDGRLANRILEAAQSVGREPLQVRCPQDEIKVAARWQYAEPRFLAHVSRRLAGPCQHSDRFPDHRVVL